ncbi:MAG: Ig-like domain-containing protein, partial [Hormoscilla sp.]
MPTFDEEFYLAQNPDVAAAVERGEFSSGFEHFQLFGLAEGRLPAPIAFDEGFYLAQNPDVAAAVAAGVFVNGLQHYLLFGQAEGRLAVPGTPTPTPTPTPEGMTVNFEGLSNFQPVGTVEGVVTFSDNAIALVAVDAGGEGNFGNPPSPPNVIAYAEDEEITLTVAPGDYRSGQLTFFYSSPNRAHEVRVLDANGNLLPQGFLGENLQPSPVILRATEGARDEFTTWEEVTIAFSGDVETIELGSEATQIGFDDIQLTLNSDEPGVGSISGTKFEDANGNGLQDPGEDGQANVTIYVDGDNDGELDSGETSVVTDAEGHYSFTELEPGTYVVREVLPEGFTQTFPVGEVTQIGMTPSGFGSVNLATPAGDGGLRLEVDAFGAFGSSVGTTSDAFYDPIGNIGEAGTTFQSGVAIRVGQQVQRTFLTTGNIEGSGNLEDPGFVEVIPTDNSGISNRAISTFSFSGLDFTLTQTVQELSSENGSRTGSLLTQNYTIFNPGSEALDLELLRYFDGDLSFDGSIIDGGGRLVIGGQEILFETDTAGEATTSTTFIGITGTGGSAAQPGRYEIDSFSGVAQRIIAGQELDDTITGDGNDADQFVDAGQGYDLTPALRNAFSLSPGASTVYTTTTIFGTGVPEGIQLGMIGSGTNAQIVVLEAGDNVENIDFGNIANQLPVAVDDAVTATAGSTETINVLDNDSDADADPISLTAFTATTANGGTVSRFENDTPEDLTDDVLTYTSAADFTGTDSFIYTISDGRRGQDTATVTVTVVAPPNPVSTDDATTLGPTTSTATIAVLDNDFDPDGNPLEIIGFATTSAADGLVEIFDNETPEDPSDDVLTYRPAEDFFGTDDFVYTVANSLGGTATATVTVTVEAPPNPVSTDDTTTLSATTPTATIAVLENDTDPDGNPLEIIGFATTSAAGALIEIFDNDTPEDPSDDVLTYTPAEDFFGTDSFVYTVGNSFGGTTTATVTVNVEAPRTGSISGVKFEDANGNGLLEPGEDGQANVTIYLDGDNDGQLDSDETSVVTDANGNYSFSELEPGTYVVRELLPQGFTQTFPSINMGAQIVTLEAGDDLTNLNFGNVANQSPVAVNDFAIATAGTTATINVLDNDSDPDGDRISVTEFTATTLLGGTVSGTDDVLTYTPAADFLGTDSFTYTINDSLGGTDTATVTVTVGNELLNAVNDVSTLSAGTTVTIPVLENDFDPDENRIVLLGFARNSANGGRIFRDVNGTRRNRADDRLIYRPDGEFVGEDSFTYTIRDSQG